MQKINWNPSSKELRQFGVVILVGFGLIGWALLRHGHPQGARGTWAVAGIAGALALLVPPASKPFYWAWMGLGVAIGAVTSRIVLALIFFGVLTPLALFFRWLRRDALRLRRPETESYFIEHPEIPRENYKHTF